MPEPNLRTANETLDEEYLLIRAKLLEIAASIDRIGRGSGPAAIGDARMSQMSEAVSVLRDGLSSELSTDEVSATGLAARLQLIFSLPYKENWRSDFGLR